MYYNNNTLSPFMVRVKKFDFLTYKPVSLSYRQGFGSASGVLLKSGSGFSARIPDPESRHKSVQYSKIVTLDRQEMKKGNGKFIFEIAIT